MKKIFLIALTAVVLTAALASCSRRGQYENQLESMKDTEKEEQTAVNGVIGDDADGYSVTAIPSPTSEKGFFEGKTPEELAAIFDRNGRGSMSQSLAKNQAIPTGKRHRDKFYNCLTGNISEWCSDILCDGDHCIWSSGDTTDFLYVSDKHIYFISSYGDSYPPVPKLYRCDFQRNNIELLYEIPTYGEEGYSTYELNEILYVKDDVVYFTGYTYGKNGEGIYTLKTLDIKTGEVQLLSGKSEDINVFAIVGDMIYYSKSAGGHADIYRSDLTLSNPQLFFTDAAIEDYSDNYMVIEQKLFDDNEVFIEYIMFTYHIATGECHELPRGSYRLVGDYLYSQEMVSDEEKNGPLGDYYTWQETDGYPSFQCAIYRRKVDGSGAERVLQLTYQGIPVKITDYEIVGDVVYFSFLNHTEFKNYYNQDFNWREYSKEMGIDSTTFGHYAVADLQNGTVTFLDFWGEE